MFFLVEKRAENKKRLRALLAYRELLLGQGTRSLLIRVDRDLAHADLGSVVMETGGALETATDWALFRGKEHAGGFLSKAWLRFLPLLVLLVLVVWLSRLGRRLVDRWIERKVASYPTLATHGASVREEQERARDRREAEAVAAGSTSVELVLEREKPEAGAEPEDSAPPTPIDVEAPLPAPKTPGSEDKPA